MKFFPLLELCFDSFIRKESSQKISSLCKEILTTGVKGLKSTSYKRWAKLANVVGTMACAEF